MFAVFTTCLPLTISEANVYLTSCNIKLESDNKYKMCTDKKAFH